jgi:hypothetical protein
MDTPIHAPKQSISPACVPSSGFQRTGMGEGKKYLRKRKAAVVGIASDR